MAGGILDIELLAQMIALLSGSDARDPRAQLALSDDAQTRSLGAVHEMLCGVQQAQRLVMAGKFEPDALGRDGMNFVVSMAGVQSVSALEEAILAKTTAAAAQIERILQPK